jgi:hypothetical protein
LLPVGRTEEDPWALGSLGLPHQHIQFGTGTFDPVVRLDYYLLPDPVGFLVTTAAQVPLGRNAHGYRGSTMLDFSVGPRVKLAEWLVVGASWVASWQSAATWDGVPDANSGYFLQGVSLSAPVRLSSGLSLVVTVLRVLSVETRTAGDAFEMDWMVAVSVDASLGSGR